MIFIILRIELYWLLNERTESCLVQVKELNYSRNLPQTDSTSVGVRSMNESADKVNALLAASVCWFQRVCHSLHLNPSVLMVSFLYFLLLLLLMSLGRIWQWTTFVGN